MQHAFAEITAVLSRNDVTRAWGMNAPGDNVDAQTDAAVQLL